MSLRRIAAGGCVAVTIGVTAISGCAGREAPVAVPGPLAVELNTLVSQRDGLYFPPYLLDEPAGPEDNAFALLTAEELRRPMTVRLTAAESAKLREDALGNSGLYGRWWLSVIGEHAGQALLTGADYRAIDALRAPAGWYADTDADDSGTAVSVTDRLAATEAALSILTRRNSDIPGAPQTLSWLDDTCAERTAAADVANCASAFALLGRPEHERNTLAPPVVDLATADAQARYETLVDTYYYVTWARASGHPVLLVRDDWQKMLQDNAAGLDYAGLYLAVTVAVAADVGQGSLAAVEERLTAASLPNGLIRDVASFAGSVTDTLDALQLLRISGESTVAPGVAEALRRSRSASSQSQDRPARATVDAALVLAGDQGAASRLTADCAEAPTDDVITVENSSGWIALLGACAVAGGAPVMPRVDRWPLTSAQELVAAGDLTVAAHRAGATWRPDPGWLDAADLAPLLGTPSELPSVAVFSRVLQAYLVLGGPVDQELADALTRQAAATAGCPGLPNLYRPRPEEGCDLATTVDVRQALALLRTR